MQHEGVSGTNQDRRDSSKFSHSIITDLGRGSLIIVLGGGQVCYKLTAFRQLVRSVKSFY